MTYPRTIPILVLLILFSVLRPQTALGHEGPPFPLFVDTAIGPYIASIWADPDIGTGTFFIVLATDDASDPPKVTSARIRVQPLSERLAAKEYTAQSQPVRHGARYIAEVPFDIGDQWRVDILLDGSAGPGTLRGQVESTPDDGLGPIALAIYLVPFFVMGFIWIKATLHRRKRVPDSATG